MASSSEDEEYQSNIALPKVDLSNYRKSQERGSRNNLAKAAGKKFKPGTKSVRFPDLYQPRQSVLSNTSSTTNNSSDDNISESEIDHNLPSFHMGSGSHQTQHHHDAASASGEEVSEDEHLQNYDTDSSSSSEDTGAAPRQFEPDQAPLPDSTDITDLRRQSVSSQPSSSRSSSSKKGTFRLILRKMSLADRDEGIEVPRLQDHELSGESFLGRVLQFSNPHGGLGGGGLVPGASHHTRERTIDEEESVGGGHPASEEIEMRPLDYDMLNEEAKKLISTHVPGIGSNLHSEATSEVASPNDSVNNSTAHLLDPSDNMGEGSSSQGFRAPNPDLLVRNNVDRLHQDDDYMMLDNDLDGGYVPPPAQVHAGVLSSLLKLYQNPDASKSLGSVPFSALRDEDNDDLYEHVNHSTVDFTKFKSGFKKGQKRVTDKLHITKKNDGSRRHSRADSSTDDIDDEKNDGDDEEKDAANLPSFSKARPKLPKKEGPATNVPKKIGKKIKSHGKSKSEQRLRITVHIADILQRQRFILRMCKALMLYGAPTHRLEEYMIMTSRVLEIDGQFVYFPGTMIVAFGDAATRTSEVHLVRCAQGVNLSKLSETHHMYKGVIHDLVGVEEASLKLEELLARKNLYPPWLCVFFYALGSSMVTPFAFSGGWYDIPISFGVGLCVGYLQFFVSSMSNLYSSVFEVTASIVVSFIARAIGSINGGNTFCFSAIAQGSLALILPGYIILCGSLELQSRNIVAGSVRMFYAIIYSIFLGFGITLGAALFGWVYKGATSATTCSADHTIDPKFRILFVPMFSLCLGLINQAKFSQLPIMIAIASTGYVGNYFAGLHFKQVTEFTASIGAFIVGILGNLYSRLGKGLAVAAMLPAIFVQVPSGIASQSSLLSGVESADKITNGTGKAESTNDTLSFGSTMVQVSIGISVGLFAAALVVYPFGKKKTGLFTL